LRNGWREHAKINFLGKTTVMLQLRKKVLPGLTMAMMSLTALISIGQQAPTSTNSIGKINFILGKEGDVTIRHANNSAWLPAKLKMDILRGDRLKTAAESRCEVKLNDGSMIRLGENSEFDFQQSNLSKQARQVDATLKKGSIWANILKWRWAENKFEVKSPTAVCAVRGTIYRMEADSTTRVAVYDGQVDIGPTQDLRQQLELKRRPAGPPVPVSGPTQISGPSQVTLEQWVRLVEGYQIEVWDDGDYAKSKIDSTTEAKLDWIRWNKERDRLLR
jgi:hypothetical protein